MSIERPALIGRNPGLPDRVLQVRKIFRPLWLPDGEMLVIDRDHRTRRRCEIRAAKETAVHRP
jgi:hypothetical protein